MGSVSTAAAALRAVLFDIGGTLLEYVPEDSEAGRGLLTEGMERAYEWLRERGKPVPGFEEFSRRHWRALRWGRLRCRLRGRELRAQQVVLGVLARMGVEVRPEEVYDLTQCYYRPFGDRLRPVRGAREVLEQISAMGLRLAAVSNTAWPGYLIEEDLARYGLTEHLEFCLFSSYYGRPKPARGIFRQALRMLGVRSAEALFVGDSPRHDIRGARRVGMRTVLVAPAAVETAGADWTISNLAELIPIVVRTSQGVEQRTR